jgi:hypothetical protein
MEGSPVQMLQEKVIRNVMEQMTRLCNNLSSPEFWIRLIIKKLFGN